MWARRRETDAFAAAVAGATDVPAARCCGCSGCRSPRSRDAAQAARPPGSTLDALEITTCLRRGELEIVDPLRARRRRRSTRRSSDDRPRPPRRRCSSPTTASTIDEQVAALLRAARLTIAVAESCTGGLLRGRLTDRPGSSDYLLGGIVAYSNAGQGRRSRASTPALIERTGAVSDGGRGGAGRRRPGASRRRHRRRGHRHRRPRRRHRGEAGRDWSASRVAAADGRSAHAHDAGCPAAAPTSASARRPSRCTCSRRLLRAARDRRAA